MIQKIYNLSCTLYLGKATEVDKKTITVQYHDMTSSNIDEKIVTIDEMGQIEHF